MSTLIYNATLVSDGLLFAGALLIEDDHIKAVFTESSLPALADFPAATELVDAHDMLLMPGVIDTHVHFRDGGQAENPAGNFLTESRAARAGGVTSVIDMPNTQPPTTSLEALEAKAAAAATRCMVNYGFMLGATEDNIPLLPSLPTRDFAAIKLFLGSSTGNMLVGSEAHIIQLFRTAPTLIVAHCEEESIIRSNLDAAKAHGNASPSMHPIIRSAEACLASSSKAVGLARQYGTRLHIAHLTTAAELALLQSGDPSHKLITAEVSPNHLWFSDGSYSTLGNLIKCNPAIKSETDRLALWRALAESRIDTVGTDHAPHPFAAKQRPYFDAPSGIPSIQHSLPMMLELALYREQGRQLGGRDYWLPLIVERMCHAPARLFGIEKRGYLRPGYKADLALVDLDHPTTIQPSSLLSKCGWSPLQGETLHAQVVATYVNGSTREQPGQALTYNR
ncbi:MAG: amidohydrolase family protein [Bacteroidales bacterium]|nr:amidohydrolase family protein [Bacteroidales bacterium]